MEPFLEKYSRELLVLFLAALVLGTLLILVPQLLRAQQRAREMQHTEMMRALEQGKLIRRLDERSRFAGRTAALVPMVVVCAVSIVTCFLAVYHAESVFSVSLVLWSVAGVVSLAAITGGVALMGRLAQLQSDEEEEDLPGNPLEK